MDNRIRGFDLGRGFDGARSVDVMPVVRDVGHWNPLWNVWDFKDPDGRVFRRSHFRPRTLKDLEREFQDRLVDQQEFEGNCLLNEGINEAFLLICGLGTPTAWNNGSATIGVGDTASPAAGPTQTGLQATTNKYHMTMDTSYPTSGTQKCTHKATFATGVGNFSWQEITVVNGADDTAKNLNRKVQDMGTKTSAVTRVATLDVTLA